MSKICNKTQSKGNIFATTMNRRSMFAGSAALVSTCFLTIPAFAKKPTVYTGIVRGTGAGGYDVVAYFKSGKAVKGTSKFKTKYKGATWRFSSADNLAAFKASPARFAPAFGGYCAWAVSQGYTAKGDPRHWSIVGGKLYLNYNAGIKSKWKQNAASNIQKGRANWPSVLN